jgi:hypothetical protein
MDHRLLTGCHRVDRILTHNNNVVEIAPTLYHGGAYNTAKVGRAESSWQGWVAFSPVLSCAVKTPNILGRSIAYTLPTKPITHNRSGGIVGAWFEDTS